MKIKKARRGMSEAAKRLAKEELDKYLASVRAPWWIRLVSWFRPGYSAKWIGSATTRFVRTRDVAMKRAVKMSARMAAK